MIDIERAVFSAVVEEFLKKYPNGSYYGEDVEFPASFPCMTLVEADNYTYDRTLDAEMREHHAHLVYLANIYSNLVDGAKQQCKDILSIIDETMQNLGFTRKYCRQTRNQDERISRMTAQYKGVVSEDFRIYRR